MLNLSASTVSRALSDHPDISESTKTRVREVAKEFKYTTNLHAQLFRRSRSGLIALVLPEVNMFFTPGLIKGISKTLAASKYSPIIFLTNDSYQKEQEIIEQCLSWAVEGILISLSKDTPDLNHLEPLRQAGIKCVLLDKTIESEKYPEVKIENSLASYNAVSYLINKGHNNILGIFGNPNLSITQDRVSGFQNALKANNLPVLEENIILVNNSADLDYILPSILKHNRQISAIFTMSDELLAKTHYHIFSAGLTIPEDIAVVSISDGIYPVLIHPKITHLKNSGNKIGKAACNLLLELISESSEKPNPKILLDTKLVELESV